MTVATTNDEVIAPMGGRGLPSTILVDAHGRIVGAATGEHNQAFFEERARELLEAPSTR
jgi:hypothetical protein